jgi:hypothetical protein
MLVTSLLPSPKSLDSIARASGLIQRYSAKFSASGFLWALLQSVTKGDTSLNHLVMHLSGFVNQSMSRQAIHQRLGPAASSFLVRTIRTLCEQRLKGAGATLESCRFKRIIIEDSVVIPMAKSNAGNFPNNGNGRYATAGCKCLVRFDLLNGNPLDTKLHAARESDQSLVYEALDDLGRDDLIIRDMGFFSIDALSCIGEKGAHWISRLPASVSLTSLCGQDLSKLLKFSKSGKIDRYMKLGRKGLTCRLVAHRLPEREANANRRHIRKEAKRRRRAPNRETLRRAGWSLVITNIPSTSHSALKIQRLYTLRWSIEIKFRAFKQSCQLSRGLRHKSSFHHIEAMVLAAMIFQLLTMKAQQILGGGDHTRVSPEKTSDALSIFIMQMSSNSLTWDFKADPRHLRYETRKRPNLCKQITYCLT